jgi:hypothetical protein
MQVYFALSQSLSFTIKYFFFPKNKVNLYKAQKQIMEDEIIPCNHVQNITKLES